MSKSEMGHVQGNSVLGLAFVFHVEVLPCIDILCIDHFHFNLLNCIDQLHTGIKYQNVGETHTPLFVSSIMKVDAQAKFQYRRLI